MAGAAFASLVLHASAAWVVRGRNDARPSVDPAVTSAGEFIELPPVVPEPLPEPEHAPPEPASDAPAATMPELPDTPSGLRVRRPAAMARLALSSYSEGVGPFGVRDRLTIGQYTPRMTGSAPVRTPSSAGADSDSNDNDEALDVHEAAVPEDATPSVGTNVPATPQPESPTLDAASSVATDPIVAIEVDEAADVPRIRPPSVIEASVSLELATLPGAPLTEPMLDELASTALRAELGLDDVSLLRITRSRPRGSRSMALAFVTTLTSDELRIRVEAARRARDATSEFAERDGTWSMTALVDGVPRTLVIDGHVVVLAELGAGAAAVTGRIFADARAEDRSVATDGADGEQELAIVAARFPPSGHELMLCVSGIEVRLFAPSPAFPNGRLVASFTTRPPPVRATQDPAPEAPTTPATTPPAEEVTAAPVAAIWSTILERELRLAPASLELLETPRVSGAVVEARMRIRGAEFSEVASQLLRRR